MLAAALLAFFLLVIFAGVLKSDAGQSERQTMVIYFSVGTILPAIYCFVNGLAIAAAQSSEKVNEKKEKLIIADKSKNYYGTDNF